MDSPSFEDLLKKTPQLSRTQLNSLQEWMHQQSYLPNLDVVDLIPLLNCCDYNLEQAKELLVKYLTLRTHAPEIFRFRDPRLPTTREQMQFLYFAVVGKDVYGNSIVCLGLTPKDLKTFNAEDVTYLGIAYIAAMIRSDPTCHGYIFVVDTSHFRSGHLTRIPMSLMKKTLTFLQVGFPARIVAVHIIRLTPVVDKFMRLIMPFLSKEWRENMFFHRKNLERLYEVVPKSLLPEDFGGFLPVTGYFYKEFVDQLLDNVDWLNSLDTQVIDEHSRPGGAKRSRGIFGSLGAGLFKRHGKN